MVEKRRKPRPPPSAPSARAYVSPPVEAGRRNSVIAADDKETPKLRGSAARHANWARDENPYPKRSKKASLWNAGWDQAEAAISAL